MKNIKLRFLALSFLFGVVCVSAEGAKKKGEASGWKLVDWLEKGCRETSAKRQVPEADITKGCGALVTLALEEDMIAEKCRTDFSHDDAYFDCIADRVEDFITDDLLGNINLIMPNQITLTKAMLAEGAVADKRSLLTLNNVANLKLSDLTPDELVGLEILDPNFTGVFAIYSSFTIKSIPKVLQVFTTVEKDLGDKYKFIQIASDVIEKNRSLMSRKWGIRTFPLLLIFKNGEVVYAIVGTCHTSLGNAEKLKTIIEEQLG